MLTNWLQRSAGYHEGVEVPTEELLPQAVKVRRAGVVISEMGWLSLSETEQDALALADAAATLHADEETWADRARGEFVGELRAVRNAT